jgi:hypothetical protein
MKIDTMGWKRLVSHPKLSVMVHRHVVQHMHMSDPSWEYSSVARIQHFNKNGGYVVEGRYPQALYLTLGIVFGVATNYRL